MNEYHIYMAPFSWYTHLKVLYIVCTLPLSLSNLSLHCHCHYTHNGAGSSTTSTDTASQRDKLKGDRNFRYRHAWYLPTSNSNRQPVSYMYPSYSTDTYLPVTLNQIRSTMSDIAGNTMNSISEISRAKAGIDPDSLDWQSRALLLD